MNSTKLIRIGEVWNGTNSLFNRRFGFVVIGNFATMATWHNDFSSLLACGTLGVGSLIPLQLTNTQVNFRLFCSAQYSIPTCILLPSLSQTTILPSGSTPTPVGHWNCPLPSPLRPKWNIKPPFWLNTCTLWLWQSVMIIRPSSSTATPNIPLNSPISVPFLPNLR